MSYFLQLLFCIALFVGGYVYRGDCAEEVRATESVATAEAEVKAEVIVTKTEVKRVQRKAVRKKIVDAIAALPSPPQVPTSCPAVELTDDELRLWNASNQGRYVDVQPSRVDEAGTGGTPPADEQGPERGAQEPRSGGE